MLFIVSCYNVLMQKLYYGYEIFREDVLALIKQLKPYRFDAIVAIARGGLTLGHALSQALGIRNLQTLSTQLYEGSRRTQELLIADHTDLFGTKEILVVDDIADSGKTLQEVLAYLALRYETLAIKSATLLYKPSSIYKPDFWARESDAQWVDFFWEVDYT